MYWNRLESKRLLFLFFKYKILFISTSKRICYSFYNLFCPTTILKPKRVPLGFVCGYPVGIGGELYGGSMFIKSAASYTDQGKAIQSINEKWGDESSGGTRRPWVGRETIGIQVCKKKYSPFLFTVETREDDENNAKTSNGSMKSRGERQKFVKVVRMFGCPHHSDIRKEKIECYGVRKGWEPFGQWSLQKAQQLARRETIRLNSNGNSDNNSKCVTKKKIAAQSDDTNDDTTNDSVRENCNNCSNIDDVKTVCHNGKCLWKKRDKYDDVASEITGYSELSSEEDT